MATPKQKMSYDDENFDFNKLEAEVQQTVVAEERYWRENDTKIRAVEQRVASYDEFRDRVLAAHLRPLEKGDKISDMKKFTQVWNQHADANKSSTKQSTNADIQEAKFVVPKSGPDFVQKWKRLGKSVDDRKQFLISIGADRITELFKTEISGGLLGEFLECFLDFSDDQAVIVLDILEAFTKSQRFSLSVAFLSRKEKDIISSLFSRLREISVSGECSVVSENVLAVEQMYIK